MTKTDKADASSQLSREDVQSAVVETIISEGMVEASKVTPDATIESLEIESIEFVMILNGLEERFDIYVPVDEDLTAIKTVEGLAAEIHRRLNENDASET
ncbi:MAG: phosphopantetheine-binding protein [Pseudomonadota bacterium]